MTNTAPASPYGLGHRVLEIVGITFVFVALTFIGFRIAGAMGRTRDLIGLGAATLVGYLVADFLSGFVHWAGDTVGDETTPIFGPNFVRPFRYHHVDPKDITRHDFIETNGNNCIVVSPILAFLVLTMPKTTGAYFYCTVVVAFTSWFVFCTNQFHKWAHDDHPARWIRALQRMGLILSPEHHATHHASPQDKSYCITVGWMNPVLDRIGFFRALEAIISRVSPGALRPG